MSHFKGSGFLPRKQCPLRKTQRSHVTLNHHWQQRRHQHVHISNRENIVRIGKELGVTNLNHWFQFNASDLVKIGGHSIMYKYNKSLTRALQIVYPEHTWDLWKFSMVPQGFWDDKSNQRDCIDSIGQEIGVTSLDQWYDYTTVEVSNAGASGVLGKYGKSLSKALHAIYPDHGWKACGFQKYLADLSTQRQVLHRVGKRLGVEYLDQWYKCTALDIYKAGGRSLLEQYNNSLVEMLRAVYSGYSWKLWKFSNPVCCSLWDDVNMQEFMHYISKQLNISSLDQWYRYTALDIIKMDGGPLLDKFSNVLPTLLKTLYPCHPWHFWKFTTVPQGFWEDVKNQQKCLAAIGKELRVESLNDWYACTTLDVCKAHGGGLLHKHGNSLVKTLQALRPDHNWKPWKFKNAPQGFWKTSGTCIMDTWVAELSESLNVTCQEDWYQVSSRQLAQAPAAHKILRHFGGLSAFLVEAFPDYKWNLELFRSHDVWTLKKGQLGLHRLIQQTFPDHHVLSNYKHPTLILRKGALQLDSFIPSLSLGFEYQGEQHYQLVWLGDAKEQKKRDEEKKSLSFREGISLILVPYWWDFKVKR